MSHVVPGVQQSSLTCSDSGGSRVIESSKREDESRSANTFMVFTCTMLALSQWPHGKRRVSVGRNYPSI